MTKPTLLLLPGLLCDETVWAAQRASLAAIADCRVPVYGALDTIEAMADQVLATAPAGGFALAGHSMGGRVALEVVRRAPERVLRLALLDTGFQALPAGEAGEKERAGRYQLLALARSQGMRAMGAQWARGMVHPERAGDAVFEDILRMIAGNTLAMFESQIRALLSRPDATALLPLIGCPALLLCGRDDAWSPLARHEEMHAAIPGSRLEIIERSGHMTTMERPRAVSLALQAWLVEQQRGGDRA